MLDAIWYLECILPLYVGLCIEGMGYRFVKGEK